MTSSALVPRADDDEIGVEQTLPADDSNDVSSKPEAVCNRLVEDFITAVREELRVSLVPVHEALDVCRTALQQPTWATLATTLNNKVDCLPLETSARDCCCTEALPTVDSDDDCGVPHEVGISWPATMFRGRGDAGYQLLQSDDVEDCRQLSKSSTVYSALQSGRAQVMDPAAAARLPREIDALRVKQASVEEAMEDLDGHWKRRRLPFEEDHAHISEQLQQLLEELEHATQPLIPEPIPAGPTALRFVDGSAFSAVCNIVVLLNLGTMALAPKFADLASTFKVMDHLFLVWYVFELLSKVVYHQKSLFLGAPTVVWWNWLDLSIVVSGVIDQWFMALLAFMNGGELAINTSYLRMLRALRLFRVMRFLKILKAFLKSDLDWTEGASFQTFMAGVIAANALIMSLELDIPWKGWVYVENFLQAVYTFELALRLKRMHCGFFTNFDIWNYLDFVMVVSGALDLWLMPLIHGLEDLFAGGSTEQHGSSPMSGALQVLKIMRIFRVLRLVKLLKMVKPLYRLLTGVIASVKAMQWVMVLTFLTLYACAVVFTNLVGKGLVTKGHISPKADAYFGSVPKSLFSLFKLMNGDTSVVEPIARYVTGQLMFAGFMVVSNWAILAILTSVVSDNMISSSQKANEEDERKIRDELHEQRVRRLKALFNEIDKDGSGCINTSEWNSMLQDRSLRRELMDATGLKEDILNDYFQYLALDAKQMREARQEGKQQAFAGCPELDKLLEYDTFIDSLKSEGETADQLSVLRIVSQLRTVEGNLESHIKEMSQRNGVSEKL